MGDGNSIQGCCHQSLLSFYPVGKYATLVLKSIDVNYGAHLLLCCSENGKDAVSEMSTHCVNAFQWLTQLTVGTIFANLTTFIFFKRDEEYLTRSDLYAVNWSSLVSGSKADELLISATT